MVAQQVERQLVDHPLVRFDELRTSLVVAGGTALDERCFLTADLRPSDSPRWLDRHVRAHCSTA